MKHMTPGIAGVVALIALYILSETVFIVQQNEQCVITQFGKLVRIELDPGLSVKTPFIQDVIYYDTRLLGHDVEPTEIVTKDKRTLVIDNYAKWRITDPGKFYQRAKVESVAMGRLRDIIYSELRVDFGSHDMAEIVSTKRGELMRQVTERANAKAKELNMGVEIVDVRIKRADLPTENQQAVYRRMSEERKRIAMQFRSEGKEAAQRIRGQTDMEKAVILAEARKKEQEKKGEADALSIKITAAAYGKDPDFFEFVRSLDAYRKAFSERGTAVLSQDSPFLKRMGKP